MLPAAFSTSHCSHGVDSAILNPRNTWDDKGAYDAAATKLRDMFRSNYDSQGYAKLGIPNVM
jgi:phosphoenolpyruvate carboxykinase (ATP)